MWVYSLLVMLFVMRQRVHDFFVKEDGEVNIVATVLLIGIAVVLALLFKDNIAKLLNNLFNQVNDKSQNVFTNIN